MDIALHLAKTHLTARFRVQLSKSGKNTESVSTLCQIEIHNLHPSVSLFTVAGSSWSDPPDVEISQGNK